MRKKIKGEKNVSSDSSRKVTSTGTYHKGKAEAEDRYSCFSLHTHFPGISLRTLMLKAVGNSLERLNDFILTYGVL